MNDTWAEVTKLMEARAARTDIEILAEFEALAPLDERSAVSEDAFWEHAVMYLALTQPPEATIVFEQNLAHAEPRERTFALWGLAALGYQEPIAALILALADPDISTATSFTPGQSMRAAQALADVLGLSFEWGDKAEVDTVRQHFKTLCSSEDLATLAVDLATGKLTRNMGGGRGKV
jgi:hypothetical protein